MNYYRVTDFREPLRHNLPDGTICRMDIGS